MESFLGSTLLCRFPLPTIVDTPGLDRRLRSDPRARYPAFMIIFCFSGRRDPEDIVQKFPSVALPDVYLVIAHY